MSAKNKAKSSGQQYPRNLGSENENCPCTLPNYVQAISIDYFVSIITPFSKTQPFPPTLAETHLSGSSSTFTYQQLVMSSEWASQLILNFATAIPTYLTMMTTPAAVTPTALNNLLSYFPSSRLSIFFSVAIFILLLAAIVLGSLSFLLTHFGRKPLKAAGLEFARITCKFGASGLSIEVKELHDVGLTDEDEESSTDAFSSEGHRSFPYADMFARIICPGSNGRYFRIAVLKLLVSWKWGCLADGNSPDGTSPESNHAKNDRFLRRLLLSLRLPMPTLSLSLSDIEATGWKCYGERAKRALKQRRASTASYANLTKTRKRG